MEPQSPFSWFPCLALYIFQDLCIVCLATLQNPLRPIIILKYDVDLYENGLY